MQVTILQELSDARHKYAPGDVVDMEDDQAKRWIEAGFAEAGDHAEKHGRKSRASGEPEQAARDTGHKR